MPTCEQCILSCVPQGMLEALSRSASAMSLSPIDPMSVYPPMDEGDAIENPLALLPSPRSLSLLLPTNAAMVSAPVYTYARQANDLPSSRSLIPASLSWQLTAQVSAPPTAFAAAALVSLT